MKIAQYQLVDTKMFKIQSAAEKHGRTLKQKSPQRDFKISRINGPRGGVSFAVSYKLTPSELKKANARVNW